jgi:saccharopine dehydrogenase-like NADP-dependent oxidoreductase
MSRTTAFPAAAVARRLARGELRRPGVHAPETLGRDAGFLDGILEDLRVRGVRIEAEATRPAPAAVLSA